jgi:DNA-binding response OmpR family regulator
MTGEANLAGQRVLVVEDDYYLATDTARALKAAGVTVLGPVPNEAAAREAIETGNPTAAVVDINLGSGPAFGVARLLTERAVPFIFLTGYDQTAIPPDFAQAPSLRKPVEFRSIATALALALSGP